MILGKHQYYTDEDIFLIQCDNILYLNEKIYILSSKKETAGISNITSNTKLSKGFFGQKLFEGFKRSILILQKDKDIYGALQKNIEYPYGKKYQKML